jgi:serine/threonine protein kinase
MFQSFRHHDVASAEAPAAAPLLPSPPAPSDDSWGASSQGGGALLRGLLRPDDLPPPLTFPAVGADFLGFRLVAELGRGAFGRVYLARQGDLADRLVALKVSIESVAESRRLARLQHTNIVPVYSLHRAGPLQAVCMPYLGAATLADVLQGLVNRASLPASGKGLVSTLHDRRSRTRQPDSEPAPHGQAPAPAPPPPAGASTVTLRMLEGLSYVEAVLWLGARLADGLAHAHERGVLHRDLKPANVLLTDEGQPMLLDFNLAEDTTDAADKAQVGGTLPYMAPEHLAAFGGAGGPVDERSDVWALGVMLFELLTGRHPYPRRQGPSHAVLRQMIADRLAPPPRLRPHHQGLPRAVESIVRRCLEPGPGRRYPSAAAVLEDLERQLAGEPLRHAPDRHPAERVAKWARRHPRLTSSGTVAAAAFALLLGLGTLFALRGQRRRRPRRGTR